MVPAEGRGEFSLVCNYKKSYATEWKIERDEAKNRSNLAKHGLSFDDAEQVFSAPCVTFEDDRFDYGEPRMSASTMENSGSVVTLVENGKRRHPPAV